MSEINGIPRSPRADEDAAWCSVVVHPATERAGAVVVCRSSCIWADKGGCVVVLVS